MLLQMSLIQLRFKCVHLDDISTASSCYVVAEDYKALQIKGTLTRMTQLIDGTIGTADAVITANVNGGFECNSNSHNC